MKSSNKKDILAILEDQAYDCTLAGLKSMLQKFGENPEGFEAIREGVARRLRSEDSGSYCESASSGYYESYRKQKCVESWLVEHADTLAVDFNSAADSRKILGMLEKIAARLDVLEGKKKNPKGPEND